MKNSPVNPWMSQALLNSRKRKQLVYTRKLCRPTLHSIQQFKDFSNLYKTLCRAAKRNYYSAKIEKYKNESKKTWETLREVLGNVKDKSKTPEHFIENGNIIQGDFNIASEFNKFFCNIGPKLSNDIPKSNKSYRDLLKNPVDESFVFKTFNREDILEMGAQLKT